MIPGKPVTWSITVSGTLAYSYQHASCHSAGGAIAVSRKEAKLLVFLRAISSGQLYSRLRAQLPFLLLIFSVR